MYMYIFDCLYNEYAILNNTWQTFVVKKWTFYKFIITIILFIDEFMRQLQRDALWSDPTLEMGLHINPRGAGVGFGPDITKAFLERNKLKFVVRSHECVQKG